MRKVFVSFFITVCFNTALFSAEAPFVEISHSDCSAQWHKRNAHLIPSEEEEKALLKLDVDADGIENAEDPDVDNDGLTNIRDKDIDGDGVRNDMDPSPYDWRETGYDPFGVLAFLSWRHEWNNFKYDEENLSLAVRRMKELGVSFVRIDFFWGDIEPQKGTFCFQKYDYIVDFLSRHNIRILALLHYSTDWASSSWNSPPDNDQDFVNYCQQVVRRYRSKIKYWEIWNEPDSSFYWQPQDNMKRYSRLLKKVYVALKEVDPSCKVVLGGLTSGGYYALKNLYREGAGDYFDIINFHPFVNPLQKDAVDRVKLFYRKIKSLAEENNDGDKKIWFTEVGCPGVRQVKADNGWWEGRSPDEYQQARFLKDLYGEIVDLEDVEKIFWAFFRDNKEHFKSGVDYFGLLRWDFSKKPSFYAHRKVYSEWRKKQFRRIFSRH